MCKSFLRCIYAYNNNTEQREILPDTGVFNILACQPKTPVPMAWCGGVERSLIRRVHTSHYIFPKNDMEKEGVGALL